MIRRCSIILDNVYRHELKFIINKNIAYLLKKELSMIMKYDNFAYYNNAYFIRSLYFDDYDQTAYNEKIDGVKEREKYRIRFYNYNEDFIRIEKKEKNGDLTAKSWTQISKKDVDDLISGTVDYQKWKDDPLMSEFLVEYKTKKLCPSVIVDYNRIAFVYPGTDIRITFDEDIASGRFNKNLFSKEVITYPILKNNEIVLEVKFNDYIPKYLRDILNKIPSIRIAISKFVMCEDIKGEIL